MSTATITEWVTCPQPQVCHVTRHRINSGAYIRCQRTFSARLAEKTGTPEDQLLGIRRQSRLLAGLNQELYTREYQNIVNEYKRAANLRDELVEELEEKKNALRKSKQPLDDEFYELADRVTEARMEALDKQHTMDLELNRIVVGQIHKHTEQGFLDALPIFAGEIPGTTSEYTGDPGTVGWLNGRKVGIGGSDASEIIFGRPFERKNVAIEKATKDEVPNPIFDSMGDLAATTRGNYLEPLNAIEFQAQNPNLRLMRDKRQYQLDSNPNLIANFDGLIQENGEIVGVWESKTTNNWKDWENGIPRDVQAQLDHQMYVTGTDTAYCTVRANGSQFKTYMRTWGEPITDPEKPDDPGVYYEDYIDRMDEVMEMSRTIDPTEEKKPRRFKPKVTDVTYDAVRGIFGDDVASTLREGEGTDADRFSRVFRDSRVPEDRTFVVVDTETTGFNRTGDEIIEFGAVKVNGRGEILERYEQIFAPDDRYLRAKGTGADAVHGITPDMVRGKNTFRNDREAQARIADFITSGDAIIGHNILTYDRQMMDYASPILREAFTQRPVVDTLRMAQYFEDSTPSNTLTDWAGHYGYKEDNAHRAINDVELNAKALFGENGFLDTRRA